MTERGRRRRTDSLSRHGFLGVVNFALLTIAFFLTVGLSIVMYTYNILAFNRMNLILSAVLGVVLLGLLIWILTKKSKVVVTAFLGIIILALGTGLYFVKTALDFSTKLNTTAGVSKIEMSVVVPVDSAVKDVSQLSSVLAPVANDSDNITALLQQISEDKKVTLAEKTSLSYPAAFQSLMAGEDKAMVMNSAYAELLKSEHSDFDSKVKTIYRYTVEKKVKNSASPKVTSDSFNVYISGIDTYGTISSVSRSDVNIIMTVNRTTNKILLTTTPRDAYVAIADGGNNQYDKLTHAGIYGVDSSIHTLENLYGISIDYYARINFTTFLNLVDLVGGVTVTNDQEFTSKSGQHHYPVGNVTMNSEQALAFVRERYSLQNGDNDRGKNQTKVIAAIINKLTSLDSIGKYSQIINGLGDSIQTNMPFEMMMTLANGQLESGNKYAIVSQAITGSGSTGQLTSYAMPTSSLYMVSLDPASLESAKAAIKATMEGN